MRHWLQSARRPTICLKREEKCICCGPIRYLQLDMWAAAMQTYNLASDAMPLIGVCMISSTSTLKAMSVVIHFGVVLFIYVKDRGADSGLFKFQAWIQGATSECAHNMLQPSNFSELFKLIVTGVVSLSIGIRITCHHTIVGLLCITASQLQYRSWHIFQHLEIIDLASAYVSEFVFCFSVWGLGFL